MKMNMKTTKTMRGFMCQSPASTVVCMPSDPRSVIVPRRSERTSLEHARLMNSRYYRLMESRRLSMADNRSVTLASIKRDRDQERKPPKTSIVPPSLTSSENVFQVVVMRVSLHCQGCAGKVKKHLSKMEGVTSFSIDLETKRVTVMGHVSPVRVLESISKVKKAEFWTC